MDVSIKLAGIGVLTTVCVLALKKDNSAAAYLLAVAAGAVIIMFVADMLGSIIRFCMELADMAQVSYAIISPVSKTLGISLVTRFSAEASRDAKETAIASYIELGGAVAAMYVMLPLMRSVIRLISSL